jgi:hypothetical protein
MEGFKALPEIQTQENVGIEMRTPWRKKSELNSRSNLWPNSSEKQESGMKEASTRTGHFAGEGRTGVERTLSGRNAQARGIRMLHDRPGQSAGRRRQPIAFENCVGFRGRFGKRNDRRGASAAIFEHPASEPNFDFGLDPFLHHFAEFFTQIGDLIQPVELEGFERNFRGASKVFDGVLC